MADLLHFPHRPDDDDRRHDQDDDREPVRIDVDGDGELDVVTPAPRPAPRVDRTSPEWSVDLDTPDEAAATQVLAGRPIDPPDQAAPKVYATAVGRQTEFRPVIPAWLRNPVERSDAARWLKRYVGHRVAFHAVRLPAYLLLVLLRAPRGVYRSGRWLSRWLSDAEGAPLRSNAVRVNDPATYMKLDDKRRDKARWRWTVATGAGLGALLLLAAGAVLAPGWTWLAAVALLLVLAARVGSNPDRPLFPPAVLEARARKLTADIVLSGFVAAGLAKEPTDVTFKAPIMRDGPGWLAILDLPPGRTVGEVMDRRDKLASGLDLALGQVWPEGVPGGSLRRVRLWVGDEDLALTKNPPWPLLEDGVVDLFRPFPFGTDPRGTSVGLQLVFSNLLVGSVPRMGKSFSARVAVLAAALDVSVELNLWDFKGGADWMPFEPIAHQLVVGAQDEHVAALLGCAARIQREMDRRYEVIRNLPRDLCPEGKVTRDLADKRSLRLWPILLAVDECQVGFINKAHGGALDEVITDLVKRGPAVGIVVVLATQKPDKESLPSGIRDNIATRFGMRVLTWQTSEMVLGTGTSKVGINAASLTRRDRGVGYLVGASDDVDAELVRTHYVDGPAAERVIARARALRERAGTLTGAALGVADEVTVTVNVADDVRGVFHGDETRLWSETILDRLRELRPGVYDGWTSAALTAALRSKGIDAGRQFELTDAAGEKRTRRGVSLDELERALTAGPATPSAGDDD